MNFCKVFVENEFGYLTAGWEKGKFHQSDGRGMLSQSFQFPNGYTNFLSKCCIFKLAHLDCISCRGYAF